MAQALGKGMISAGKYTIFNIDQNVKYMYVYRRYSSVVFFYFDDAGLLKPNQIWANAPDDGTLDAWKKWECNVLINDNSNCRLIVFYRTHIDL